MDSHVQFPLDIQRIVIDILRGLFMDIRGHSMENVMETPSIGPSQMYVLPERTHLCSANEVRPHVSSVDAHPRVLPIQLGQISRQFN